MELYLQFGYGMIEHTTKLLEDWGGGGVILSPRDLKRPQLVRVAAQASKLGAEPLLDPQCYLHDADHPRLTDHAYWKTYRGRTTANLLNGPGARDVMTKLYELDRALGVQRHMVPGLLANSVTADWFAVHERFLEAGVQEFKGEPLIATIALSAEALRDETQIEAVIEQAADWPVKGFYVVAEVPSGYLVEDPVWLANLLILTSGLKLLGRHVLVGYSSHQMLCLAASNVDAMAAGTWLNVRAFRTGKFYAPQEDEVSRRTTWYYCPRALSEYKIQFLDLALRHGILNQMGPDPALGSRHADSLFTGIQPTTVRWSEQSAFRHYLTCLRSQCRLVTAPSFAGAMALQAQLLDSAHADLRALRAAGVFGNDRDFSEALDANRGALIAFERARGARLHREW